MNRKYVAWILALLIFVGGTYTFTIVGRLAEAFGGSGTVMNAMIISLMFAAHVMDKIDPVEQ